MGLLMEFGDFADGLAALAVLRSALLAGNTEEARQGLNALRVHSETAIDPKTRRLLVPVIDEILGALR